MSTTYGGLLAAAADAVQNANLAVGRRRFDSPLDAAQALVDFHGLLDSLAGHTWVLLTPEQAAGVRASHGPHPVEVAAIAMAEAIGTLAGSARPHPALHTELVTSWARDAGTPDGATWEWVYGLLHGAHEALVSGFVLLLVAAGFTAITVVVRRRAAR